MRCGAACEKVKSYLKMVAQAGIVKSVWSEADAGTVLNDWATATWQLQHVERERTNTTACGKRAHKYEVRKQ
jgi:hypothetical protein